METQGLKEKTQDLLSHGADYLDTFYKIGLVKAAKKATYIASSTITVLVIATLGMFALFFLGFGAAWWVGNLIDSRSGGFLIVAAFFFIVSIIIILMRKKILFPYVRNLLIRKTYDQ